MQWWPMNTFSPGPLEPVLLNPETVRTLPCLPGFEEIVDKQRANHAEILHRAHSIWESKGRRDDRHIEDWLEAEAEVLAQKSM